MSDIARLHYLRLTPLQAADLIERLTRERDEAHDKYCDAVYRLALLASMEHAKNEYATLAANRWTEIERLREALLARIRQDTRCVVPRGDCTGWDAERCGCAEEAREIVAALTPPRAEGETD